MRPIRRRSKQTVEASIKEYGAPDEDSALSIYANHVYPGDRICLTIEHRKYNELAIFQTTIADLERCIAEFKTKRGIKRVPRSRR